MPSGSETHGFDEVMARLEEVRELFGRGALQEAAQRLEALLKRTPTVLRHGCGSVVWR